MNIVEDNIVNTVSNHISLSDKYCNICTENIENDKLVTLACNPNHYFCYTCIFDWFDSIKNGFSYDNKQCTCPICKKDGGVLPLLPPHTTPVVGVHVIGKTFNDKTCDHKDCNDFYSYIDVKSKNKQYKNLCYTHYYQYKKGIHITLENDEIFESPYIQCNCKTPNNSQCTNINKYNKMYSIILNDKKYYLCDNHTKLYNHGIQLTLNDDMIASTKSTHKNICCFPNNKLKYGYCLVKLDNKGLCTTISHIPYNEYKKNIDLEDNGLFGDSNIESKTKITNSKVMNIHIGLCGATLKNGFSTCQNKGKPEYNGKCGKHKNC